MHIGTNKSGTKLTRPVAMWKRVLAFIFGVVGLLGALGALGNGAGWLTLLPLLFGIGCLIAAFEKYETLG
jgi:hypothetical protein